MEEMSLPAETLPPLVSELPEALQAPTKRVSLGFMLALMLASSVLYMCYIGIGGLMLPLQVSTIDPANMVVFGLVPSWNVLMITMGVMGIGFGIYVSVDSALVTQVLPSANNRAKDMGIINIANTLPQSLAPATAAFIINTSHSYMALFMTGAVIALFGIVSVLPIKSVR